MNFSNYEEAKVLEPKKFVCEYPGCGRLFKTKFSMKRHAFVHSNNKKYVCKYCGKRFALPQYMREHTYTHTKDKPYVCGVAGCHERFRQAGKLSLHRRTHPEYKLKHYDCSSQYKYNYEDKPMVKQELEGSADAERAEPKDVFQVNTGSPETRVFTRQNSGRTSILQEEGVFPKELQGQREEDKEGTEENPAAEVQDRDQVEMLKQYLDLINSPLTLIMRPVLPVPEKRLGRKLSLCEGHSDINLCDLLVRFDKQN